MKIKKDKRIRKLKNANAAIVNLKKQRLNDVKYSLQTQALKQLKDISCIRSEQKKMRLQGSIHICLDFCQRWLINKKNSCSLSDLVVITVNLSQFPHMMLKDYKKLISAIMLRINSIVSSAKKDLSWKTYCLLFNALIQLPIDFYRYLNILSLLSLKCINAFKSKEKITLKKKGNLIDKLWKICVFAKIQNSDHKKIQFFVDELNIIVEQMDNKKVEKFPLQELITREIEKLTLLSCQVEYRVGLYNLDIAFPDQKIGIEIDGSQHYIKHRLCTKDEFRDFILQGLGWRMMRLPSYEYKKAIHQHTLKSYLIQKLHSFNILLPQNGATTIERNQSHYHKNFFALSRQQINSQQKEKRNNHDTCTYTQLIMYMGFKPPRTVLGVESISDFSVYMRSYFKKQVFKIFVYQELKIKQEQQSLKERQMKILDLWGNFCCKMLQKVQQADKKQELKQQVVGQNLDSIKPQLDQCNVLQNPQQLKSPQIQTSFKDKQRALSSLEEKPLKTPKIKQNKNKTLKTVQVGSKEENALFYQSHTVNTHVFFANKSLQKRSQFKWRPKQIPH